MPLVLNSSSITGLAAVGGLSSLPTGSVIQTVNQTYTTRTAFSSPSSWQDTGVTASITPRFSTSKILVLVTLQMYQNVSNSQNNVGMSLQVLRDATSIYRNPGNYGAYYNYISVDAASGSREQAVAPSVTILDSPATTSSITYKVQGQMGNSGSLVFQDDSSASSIVLMEIAA
jgi:hypothetical protein